MAAEIGTLQRGSRLEGVVTGVLSYAAFVDVGVKKDGMLHACEIRWLVGRSVHDMREWVKVGDRLAFNRRDCSSKVFRCRREPSRHHACPCQQR